MGSLDVESYGPSSLTASPERVGAFVAATGDDPRRWADHAPPGFAAVALIAAAAELLEAAIAEFDAVVHTRQRFEWQGPLEVGAEVEVSGRIVSARERSGTTLVEFAAMAPGWMTSTSHFLMTGEGATGVDEVAEPEVTARAANETPEAMTPGGEGDPLAPLAKSASRLDIAHYAAASGDWNPIHWDHGSAVAAGLGGVVAHGLLMASWLAQAAARLSSRPDPLATLEVRFRNPLRPAAAAQVDGTVVTVAPLTVDLVLTAGDVELVTAKAEVVTA